MYDDDDMARGGAPSKSIAAMQLKSLMKRLKDGKIWSRSIIAMSIRKKAKWERHPPHSCCRGTTRDGPTESGLIKTIVARGCISG